MRNILASATVAILALSGGALAQTTSNPDTAPGVNQPAGGTHMSAPNSGSQMNEGRASANDSGGAIKPGRTGESNGNNNTGSNGQ